MLWTSPTAGIAMCQSAVVFDEPRMSESGYKQLCRPMTAMVCSALNTGSSAAMSAFRRISSALPLKADVAPAANFRLLVNIPLEFGRGNLKKFLIFRQGSIL